MSDRCSTCLLYTSSRREKGRERGEVAIYFLGADVGSLTTKIALIEQRRVILKNRKGKPRTEQYPELQILAELVKVKNAVLDGEVIALAGGKPSFARVIQRDFCRREPVIRALQRQIRCV